VLNPAWAMNFIAEIEPGGIVAEFELGNVIGRSHVIRGPANVGLFETGNGGAILIDAGNDDDAGRKILRICAAKGMSISLIANTHSHADHCGGNSFIQTRTNCRIAATRAEAAFIETPVLEPSYLWGAFPMPALRNKFLMTKASRVTDIIEAPGPVTGTELFSILLPGHFIAMAGFMTPDRVFFVGDAVANLEILAKHPVFYLYDIGAQLETLSTLMTAEAEWFVPSHAEPTRDIAPLALANRTKIEEISAFIENACLKPSSPESLLAALVMHYEIQLNHAQYVLVGSTLRSYLSWLIEGKRIASRFEEGQILFERI
jgi:glyoxylase-like metal-dependent hydrolase (beta-lactamase superfamily II)